MKQMNQTKDRRACRSGASMIEIVVSAVLLMTFMTFVTTLCFRVNLVWRDVAHQRFAVGELANHLDSLTRLSKGEAAKRMESLKPSSACEQTLNTPAITGTLIEDRLGTRVALQLDWERGKPGLPVELVGWLIASENKSAEPEPGPEMNKDVESGVESDVEEENAEAKESDK